MSPTRWRSRSAMTGRRHRADSPAGVGCLACASGLASTAASLTPAREPRAALACAPACRWSDSPERGSRPRALAPVTHRRDDRRDTLRSGSATMKAEPWLRRHIVDGLVITLVVVQQGEVWVA